MVAMVAMMIVVVLLRVEISVWTSRQSSVRLSTHSSTTGHVCVDDNSVGNKADGSERDQHEQRSIRLALDASWVTETFNERKAQQTNEPKNTKCASRSGCLVRLNAD